MIALTSLMPQPGEVTSLGVGIRVRAARDLIGEVDLLNPFPGTTIMKNAAL